MIFCSDHVVLVSFAPCCSGVGAVVAFSTAAVAVAVSTPSSWLFGVGSGTTLPAAHSADFLNCRMVHILWLIGRDLFEGSCLLSMWRWARVLFHERALSHEGCFRQLKPSEYECTLTLIPAFGYYFNLGRLVYLCWNICV